MYLSSGGALVRGGAPSASSASGFVVEGSTCTPLVRVRPPDAIMQSLSERAQGALSAALRHVRDAEHLADPSNPHASVDQAFHLAGFGPECVRKAVLSDGALDKAIGHGVGEEAERALEAALAWDVVAHRYQPRGWPERFPTLLRWSVEARYKRTGYYSREQVEALLADARRAVDEVTLALWADGRLPRTFPW